LDREIALVSAGAATTVSELRRRFDEYLAAMTKGKSRRHLVKGWLY
jgi:hypothetical protein